MHIPVLALFTLISTTTAWLPSPHKLSTNHTPHPKIRGVNLGNLFIFEPWMSSQKWSSIGCGSTLSETDCVSKLGQEAGDKAFQKHWSTWITADDFDKMKEYGLNTVRIPVGYWIVEEAKFDKREMFPRGGIRYLDRVVQWAKERDIFVILDLHGGPGAQVRRNPSTGQYVETANFYTPRNYARALKALESLTHRIHTHPSYRTVGTLEVLNEPEPGHPDLLKYYAAAYTTIQKVEKRLRIAAHDKLTIAFMNAAWGAGNPASVLPAKNIGFDGHSYPKFDRSFRPTKKNYINKTCKHNVAWDNNTPVVVGEWSLGVRDDVEKNAEFDPRRMENWEWYRQWWAVQVVSYEKQLGWVFWSWKTELGGDWRWSYRQAVEEGVVPMDPDEAVNLARCPA